MSSERLTSWHLRLFDSQEMADVDRATVRDGRPFGELVATAGLAVAAAVRQYAQPTQRIAVLAGPGNNGADARVAAADLIEGGWSVEVYAVAADAAARPIALFDPAPYDFVVDGLFGAGLSRPLDGKVADAVNRLNDSRVPVLSIDIPSGVSADSGAVLGVAVEADACITFERRKPGHLLLPGRALCGAVHVASIGLTDAALDEAVERRPSLFANEPPLWLSQLARPASSGHKFDRGHATVFSGGATQTGAARLSATAALRAGAGLVTLASPPSAVFVNAAHLTAVMLKSCGGEGDVDALLQDSRRNTFVLGPGFGIGSRARSFASLILREGRRLVLDADGITSFADEPDRLFELARASGDPKLVLTPHEGEFARLFPDLAKLGDLPKPERARRAAVRSGAVVVMKGADTVIASPDGRAAINATGTPWLATAGSGDVLSGIVAAQLAQGVSIFDAACAGVWIHGRAAEHFGPGLIAEDLPGLIPRVLAELFG
jgi:NAD(P)H-hydrate epimerase